MKSAKDRPRAYLEFVNAVDNLVLARKRAETDETPTGDMNTVQEDVL